MDEKNLDIDSGDVMVVQHDIYLMTIVHFKWLKYWISLYTYILAQ